MFARTPASLLESGHNERQFFFHFKDESSKPLGKKSLGTDFCSLSQRPLEAVAARMAGRARELVLLTFCQHSCGCRRIFKSRELMAASSKVATA